MADSETPPAPAPRVLSLQLQVDFAAHEARLWLAEASEPVRLRFEAGRWRHKPSTDEGIDERS